MIKKTNCKSCGADIFFLQNPKSGKFIPFDFGKTIIKHKGIVYADENGILKISEGNEAGYISHFATCPDADKFRKK